MIGEKETNPRRRIPNNWCRYSALQERGGNPQPLTCVPCTENFLSKCTVRREESNFIGKETRQTGRCPKSTSMVIGHVESMCLCYDAMRMALYLWSSCPNSWPSLTMIKIPESSQIVGHSTKYLTGTPQECQGYQEEGKSEKLWQPGGDHRDMTMKCDVMPGRGSWDRKRTLGNN